MLRELLTRLTECGMKTGFLREHLGLPRLVNTVDIERLEFHKDLRDLLVGQLIRVGVRMDLIEAEAFNSENHLFQA